nr:Hypothetical protein CBG12694 [Haemonchus contortus]
MWAILLLATTVLAEDVCKQRCDRIYQRSLARVGFDDDKLNRLLETQRPLGTLRDICWRIYDNLDCMKQCDRTTQEHEEFASNVRSKCRYVLRAMESPLKCISRHHSSIGERCTTFLKEAEKLKSLADPSYKPSQRVCRYLHLNTLCLENSVTMYCANAKKLFRRLNFRDYFLNFILPSNDTLFDDLDLDACQMYDFVKQNNKMSDAQLDKELTTVINYLESSNEVTRPMMFTTTSTTSTNSQEKKEFTSLLEELLEDPLMSSSKQPIISKVAATSTTGTQQQSSRKTTSKFSITSTSTTTTSAPTTTSSTVLTTSTKRPFITATNSAQSTDSTDLVDDDDGDYGDYEADIAADNLPEEAAIDEGDEISEASSTARNRVFSEDSWEFTPPNFRYSSMRNGGVTPLSIDTSTLFGMDDDDDEYAGDDPDALLEEVTRRPSEEEAQAEKPVDNRQPHKEIEKHKVLPVDSRQLEHNQESQPSSSRRTSQTTTKPRRPKIGIEKLRSPSHLHSTSPVPFLEGSVVVKKIYSRNDLYQNLDYGYDDDDDVDDDNEVHMNTVFREEEPGEVAPAVVENTTVMSNSAKGAFDRDTLVLVYSLLLAIAVFTLMFALICFTWCRKTGHLTITKPSY